MSLRRRDSLFSVATLANVALDDINENIKAGVCRAGRFAQTENLLRVRLDFLFVQLRNREQSANTFFGAYPPLLSPVLSLSHGINLRAGPRFLFDDEVDRLLNFIVRHVATPNSSRIF